MKTFIIRATVLIGMALALAGCDSVKETYRTTEEFKIVAVKPPKRFYVTIEDTSGEQYRVYISKRCSTWRQVVIGSKVSMERYTYIRESGSKQYSFRPLTRICPSN